VEVPALVYVVSRANMFGVGLPLAGPTRRRPTRVIHRMAERRIPAVICIGNPFFAGLGFVQENQAQNALALLRKRLPVKARVLREGPWQLLPAEDLVPQIRSLVLGGLALGSLILVFSFGIFLAGRNRLQLPLPQLQSLVFITLVFTGQGTVYLVRQRQHFWKSRPSKWLVLSSVADIVVVSILASRGILMEAIPLQVLFGVLIPCVCYLVAVDLVKTGLLRKLPQ